MVAVSGVVVILWRFRPSDQTKGLCYTPRTGRAMHIVVCIAVSYVYHTCSYSIRELNEAGMPHAYIP